MQEISEYKVVSTDKTEVLNVTVSVYIKEGWQPFGCPFISPSGNYLMQTIVKYVATPRLPAICLPA